MKRTFNHFLAATSGLTVVILVLFLMLALGNSEINILVWFPAIPVLAVFLLGNRNGGLVSVVFLMITFIFLALPENFSDIQQVNPGLALRILGTYLALHAVASIVEYHRRDHLRAIELELLEAKNETKHKESFISKLSHQIRTPLSNIMLVGHMVNKVDLTPEQKDMMDTIIASANNLVSTIENIAEIADTDLQEGKVFEESEFSLNQVINGTVRLFRVQKEPAVDFDVAIDEPLRELQLRGNVVHLKQVFLNLIEAIFKNKKQGKIKVTISAVLHHREKEKAEVRFEIRTDRPVTLFPYDHESDYPKSDYSMHYTRHNDNLDLNIASKIIIQMNGRLRILRTQEKNPVFLFTLPFAVAGAGVLIDKGDAKQVPRIDRPVELKDASLLLVEDNEINQKIVVLSLKNYIGNIDVAANGKEALDKFGTSRYDVILMDVQMPVIDGFVATRKIREIEATTHSHTPIIAITANALHGDREKCIEAGMDDYISKPFQVEELVEKISRQLQP
jgi:CheY-like chemotaxis protein/signal transduction histidine kinase